MRDMNLSVTNSLGLRSKALNLTSRKSTVLTRDEQKEDSLKEAIFSNDQALVAREQAEETEV